LTFKLLYRRHFVLCLSHVSRVSRSYVLAVSICTLRKYSICNKSLKALIELSYFLSEGRVGWNPQAKWWYSLSEDEEMSKTIFDSDHGNPPLSIRYHCNVRIFSKGTPVSSIGNTVHQDVTEILLITNNPLSVYYIFKEMKNK
jgi:hypothetical protein